MKPLITLLLVLVCSALHGAVPAPIVTNVERLLNHDHIPIVGIGGCPGVGKSTMANLLARELAEKNIRCAILNFDHFGKTQEEKKLLKNDLDIRRIRWDDLYAVLQAIERGDKEIPKPTINQLTKERSVEILDLRDADVVLFEGMYALSDTDQIRLRPYLALGIYMETTTENICQWKWEREHKKSIPRTKEQFEDHMSLVFDDFIRFVYPTKRNADWVVFADDHHALTLK